MSVLSHPSFFTLDELRLGLPVSDEVRTHSASCPSCQKHLALSKIAPPAWLTDLPRVPPFRRARRRWPIFALAPALMAAIAVVALWVPSRSGIYVGTKGPPAITVFVKRGEHVARWDGQAPVHPGDSLRLQIGANDYHHASIALLIAGQEPEKVLWSGPLPTGGAMLLPVSFRVDEQGSEEILSLVLTHAPVNTQLHRRLEDPRIEAMTWRQILVFTKTSIPEKQSP